MTAGSAQSSMPEAVLKATALLIAMGRPLAQRLVAKLNQEELRLVSLSAKTLPQMNRAVVEALVEEFAKSFIDQVANTTPDAEIDAILNEGLGKEAAGKLFTPAKIEPPQDLWPLIATSEPERIVEALAAEPDSVFAAALTQLPSPVASKVLALLDQQRRGNLVRCLLEIGTCSPLAIRTIETKLYATLNAVDPGSLAKENVKKIAALLNGMGRENAREILETLAADDPLNAKSIEAMLFDFEDVSRLDHVSRVALFDTIKPEQVVFALSASNTSLCEIVLSALGGRARRMVEAELSNKANVGQDKSNAARRAIADAALAMMATGRIQMLPQPE